MMEPTVDLEITEADISTANQDRNDGQPRCLTCPTAQAANRYFGQTTSVGAWYVTVGMYAYHLPQTLSDQIAIWDQGCRFRPGTYTITRMDI
jgi:hypothetical protein